MAETSNKAAIAKNVFNDVFRGFGWELPGKDTEDSTSYRRRRLHRSGMRRRIGLGCILAGTIAALTPSLDASAKATLFWKPVEHVKAKVYRVETGEEPGDADWDLYLRPVSID